MKVYVVYLTELIDCATFIKILGVYSSNEKAIERVNNFELYELEDRFCEDEIAEGGLRVFNHNNGYLDAHLDYDFHEVTINVKETDLDKDCNLEIFNIS